MSWNAFHSRGETLQAVVDTANARRDGVLPMQVPGVAQNFTDETDLVGAMLLKWHARLSGNIERALSREPINLEAAVADAWRRTAEQLPGVRLVVDRCTQWPETEEMATAMDRAREKEWIRLAIAAGLASGQGPGAVAAGRRVEELARRDLAAELVVRSPEASVEDETTVEAANEATNEAANEAANEERSSRRSGASESFVDRIKAVLAA